MSVRTFGSDPEFLLIKDHMPHSAIGVVQGTTDNRIKLKGHQFYYDNVLAECAVKPGKSKKEVINNFRQCLQIYADMVKPFKLTTFASAFFMDNQLQHEDARKAGCAPDNCAYEQKQMDPPKEAIENGNSRSCGGHIHLGADVLVSNGPEPVFQVFLLDLFVGVPSLFLDKDPSSPARRRLYGQAGRYRTKDYGIEYRSLSNFWLNSPKMTGLIYDLCMFSIDFLEDGRVHDLWKFDEDLFFGENMAEGYICSAYDTQKLRDGINRSDKETVREHWALVKEHLTPGLLLDLENAINSGSDNYDADFYRNWELT